MKINWSYHIHTDYTHGQNSVDAIAAYCKNLNIQEIAITEHIRSRPSYQFKRLRLDILKAAKKNNIKIFTGIETKILPDGTLDAPANLITEVDVVIGSVHTWPKNINLANAYALLAKSKATIIGHPQVINKEIIELFIKHKKIMELSYRYPLRDDQLVLISRFPKLRLSFGTDAHKLLDIKNAQEYFTRLTDKYNFSNQVWKIGEKV